MAGDRRRVHEGEIVLWNGERRPARPSCGGEEGTFFCLACDGSGLLADSEREVHVIAWLCPRHGLEVP